MNSITLNYTISGSAAKCAAAASLLIKKFEEVIFLNESGQFENATKISLFNFQNQYPNAYKGIIEFKSKENIHRISQLLGGTWKKPVDHNIYLISEKGFQEIGIDWACLEYSGEWPKIK